MTDATRDIKGTTGSSGGSTAGGDTISGTEWLERLSEALGVPAPSQEEVDALLGLAGIAAHASERTAAPLSTWLVGRAGVAAADAKAIAADLAGTLGDHDGA